jgi:hypothetical protein
MNYTSLDQLVRLHRLVLPSPRDTWRLVKDPVVGQITGLPDLRGRTIATNGILVIMENEVGRITMGHLEWFEPDYTEVHVELSDLWGSSQPHKPTAGTKPRLVKTLADYVGL